MMERRRVSVGEVVCVVAIVALLAVIFYPVCATAEGDNQVTCAGNLRQIGQAFVMYARENNDRLPNADYYTDKGRDKWYSKYLKPYVRDASVTRCPSTEGRGWNPYSNTASVSDYLYPGFDPRVSGDGTLEKPYWGFAYHLALFKYPSLFLLSRDLQAVVDNNSVPPHNGGYNWVAVDGHVRWMTWSDINAVGLLEGNYHYLHQYAVQHVR